MLASDDVVDNLIPQSSDPMALSKVYAKENMASLYKKIWKPLEKYTKKAGKVFFSPAGMLSFLNFNLLYNGKSELGESLRLIRVSSSNTVASVKANTVSGLKNAALLGNIDYNMSAADMAEHSKSYSVLPGSGLNTQLALRSENERGRWGAIPATGEEIGSVKDFLTSGKVSVSVYEGKNAIEESVKAMSGNSPSILHFATHGFYLDNEEDVQKNKFVATTKAYTKSESSLLLSGLLLAGANNIWTGHFALDNVEDGVLTADEISRLDLSNTRLVVLSACETARGEISETDGVIGLQRAFKKAGAGSILMSLWKVDDDATKTLVASFYKHLMNGDERHSALKNAMNDTRKVFPDPYYWAGFVLLD